MSDLDDFCFLGDDQGQTLFGHRRFRILHADELCRLGPSRNGAYVFGNGEGGKSLVIGESRDQLHAQAAFSLTEAAQYLHTECGYVLKLDWGFRSLEDQHRMFRNALLRTGDFQRTIRRVAPPGWSEHHTGLAVDLGNPAEVVAVLLPYFGWQQSFPEGNPSPIQHQPWHWRFIGAPVIHRALADGLGGERYAEIGRQNLAKYQNVDFSGAFLGEPPPARQPRDPFLMMAEYLLELGQTIPQMGPADYRKVLLEAGLSTLKEKRIGSAVTPQAVLLALNALLPLLPGDRSERVRDFQENLARLGVFRNVATGFFGPRTVESVKLGRKLLRDPGSAIADIGLLRTVRTRSAMTLETFSPSRLAEVLKGEWIGGVPDNLILRRLVHGPQAQRIGSGDLVVACCATEGWNDLERCVTKIDAPLDAALMVDGDDVPGNAPVPVLKVRGTGQAITQLGRVARARAKGKFIVVTGSSGKTTTKAMLQHLLSQQTIVRGTAGSANSLRAISYSLVNNISEADIFVMESGLGMAGSGILQHSLLLNPDIAVVTSVHAAHAGGYATVKEIVHRKMEIAAGLKKDGYLFLDGDSVQLTLMRELAEKHRVKNIITFGLGKNCAARVLSYRTLNTCGTATLSLFGEQHRVTFPMLGEHWAKMAAVVLACGALLEMNLKQMAADFKTAPLPPGRGAVLGFPGETLVVFDSHYNANPGSMRADLAAFGDIQLPGGSEKIAVIGSMKELGHESDIYHLALAPHIAAAGFSRIHLVGEEAEVLKGALSCDYVVTSHAETGSVIESLKDELKGNEWVFVKGSRSNALERVTDYLLKYISKQQRK